LAPRSLKSSQLSMPFPRAPAAAPRQNVGAASQSSMSQQSAHRLFKYVSGVLNGAFPTSNVIHYTADVRAWSTTPTRQPSFELACDGLAAAIEAGLVPEQGRDVLRSLITKAEGEGRVLSERLRASVKLDVDQTTSTGTSDLDGAGSSCSEGTLGSSVAWLFLDGCADVGHLHPSYPLRDRLLGHSGEHLAFIGRETGLQVVLDDNTERLQIRFSCSSGSASKQQFDQATSLAKDLISVVVNEWHDAWLKAHTECSAESHVATEKQSKECQDKEPTRVDSNRPRGEQQSTVNRIFRYVANTLSGVRVDLAKKLISATCYHRRVQMCIAR